MSTQPTQPNGAPPIAMVDMMCDQLTQAISMMKPPEKVKLAAMQLVATLKEWSEGKL